MNNVFFRSSKLLISVDKLIKFESHLWSSGLNLYTQRLCHRDRQNHENLQKNGNSFRRFRALFL